METPAIIRTLAPRIAVLSSADVDELCVVNGLPNLVELIRPFEGDVQRVSIRTSQLQTVTAPTFPLRFATLASLESQPFGRNADRTEEGLDALGATVGRGAKGWDLQCPPLEIDGAEGVDAEYLSTSMDELTPWYAACRDIVLSTRPISEHETFNHPVAVVLAISSSNRDPLNAMAQLYDRVNSSKLFSSRPYMDPTVLRYFLVVHDVAGGVDLDEAQKLLGSIKRTYGPHASLLPINSLSSNLPPSPFLHPIYSAHPPSDILASLFSKPSPNSPEEAAVLGSRMTDVDVASVKGFLREMTVQSLLPFMERCVTNWNELFQSSRRGITGRLFGAGRKFFGSSRPASPSPTTANNTTGYNIAGGFYPHSTPEATSRKLGDFAFMLRDYRFAATVYDSIRKDYASDKALKYQAGANEMFGLALLMTSPPRTKLDLDPYLEQAVLTYISRGPSFDPMRATLLYYEGYRTLKEYRSASVALFRAAGDHEEIPSAILIEQAALCDLRLPRPAMRKYAFHMVAAANRYEKCGQKSFSRRCLTQAVVLYRRLSWTRAQTHIEHALGRQAYTMGQSDTAVDHFVRLLKGQEGAFLADFELAFEHLQSQHPEKISELSKELPEPVFLAGRTSIRSSGSEAALRTNSPRWAALEERFLDAGFDNSNAIKRKRPSALFDSSSDHVVSVGDVFHVTLVARNPLDVPLVLGDVTVECADVVALDALEIETIPDLTLAPGEARTVSVAVTALAVQKITFTHVSFLFHRLLPCRQLLTRRGKRLHATQAQRLTPTYAVDRSLNVTISPPRPRLVMSLASLPLELGGGETRTVTVELRNEGGAALRDLRFFSNDFSSLSILQEGDAAGPSSFLLSNSEIKIPNDLAFDLPSDIPLPNDTLAPGDTVSVSVSCYGAAAGSFDALLLFVYSSSDPSSTPYTSTLAHSFNVLPILDVELRHHPSTARPTRHVLGLNFVSKTTSEVVITGVAALSPVWMLNSATCANAIGLRSFESHRSVYGVEAGPSSEGRSDMHFTATQLQRLLSGSDLGSSIPSAISCFLTSTSSSSTDATHTLPPDSLRRALAFKRAARLRTLSTAYPMIPSASLRQIFPLFEPRDLDVVVSWEIAGEDRRGLALLSGTSIGPSESIFLGLDKDGSGARVIRSMFEATDVAKKLLASTVLGGPLGVEQDPIRIDIEADSEVAHDFSTGPYCTEIVLVASNCSPFVSARVDFSLAEPLASPLLTGAFTGQLSRTSVLAPLASDRFTATFWATRPGMYDLAGWSARTETGAGAAEEWKARVAFEQRPTEIREFVVKAL